MEDKKPPEYEDVLGDYGPQIHDQYCGEPIGWGFQPEMGAFLGTH